MSSAPPRRARGHYSPLICTRCRARKIKCLLPPTVTSPTSSAQAQQHHQACQRCRQNGFDCIVDSTVLGRPGQRIRGEMRVNSDSPGNSGDARTAGGPDHDQDTTTASPYTREYLLSQPYGATENAKIPATEVCEALSTPLRFLAVLLGRHPAFAKQLIIPRQLSPILAVADIIGSNLLDQLEPRYAGVPRN